MDKKRSISITTRDRRVTAIVERKEKQRELSAWERLRRKRVGMADDYFPSSGVRDREFHHVYPDNSWTGERCFIIGGGESLKGFDFSLLNNELTIALNRSFEYLESTIILWMDSQSFYRDLMNGDLGEDVKEKFYWSRSIKVALNIQDVPYPPEIYTINSSGTQVLSPSIEVGLGHGGNSGYTALNMAVCLGANPIYLLGFDMKGDGKGNQSWFHDGYKKTQRESVYKRFIENFNFAAPLIKEKGIKVINLNPESNLRCFDFGEAKDINPPLEKQETISHNNSGRNWIAISFYTAGTSYEREVKKLIASFRGLKIPYYLFNFKPLGTWRENLNYKSECILRALEMFPKKDIVFIDADAIVRSDPVLFDQLSRERKYDVAATFHRYSARSGDLDELLSGTLWIRNNITGKRTVKKWHDVGLRNPGIRHQKCLHMALKELPETKVYRMPFEYTCVFDYARAVGKKPVIEHFQASRRFRKEVGYGENLISR
jgi:hypothetical protein